MDDFRQAAIEKVEMLFKTLSKEYVDMMGIGYNHAVSDSLAILKNIPSAESEVISCLDCIHYTPLGIDKSWGRCAIHSSPTENQRMCQSCDFCAWAERREDG